MENSALRTYELAQAAFRRSDLRTTLNALGQSKLPKEEIRRLLTESEWLSYQEAIKKAIAEEKARLSPEEQLSNEAVAYWTRAQKLMQTIRLMPKRAKNPITGQKDFSKKHKAQRIKLKDEAAELAENFNDRLTTADKALFREQSKLLSTDADFDELEADLPILKTRAEADPRMGVSLAAEIQRHTLEEALRALEPQQQAEVTFDLRAQGQRLRHISSRD